MEEHLNLQMRDRHGTPVTVGDVVRVLEIAPEVLALLADDERPHHEAMLGKEYEIDDLPEPGKISVSIWWEEGEGRTAHGGLYLLSHEFEFVRKGGS
ncbi:hypothetical protein [Ideonella oryzae]|uniref:Uncharacterized protein n=1 Tax=Ideonella oryzae TaxID=2937441 RepID=A0ABT1BUV7_9BURK|nr:hypothetical protein [Ideonella oryzae]MCO5979316.1 hypothetical protein [Ideonella oryzae]